MTQKSLVRDIIEHREKEKIGFMFNVEKEDNHIMTVSGGQLLKPEWLDPKYLQWGRHEELIKQLEFDFNGEVRYDFFGNIYGRLNGITKGECIKGCLSDWDNLKNYEMPKFDLDFFNKLKKQNYKNSPKYIVAGTSFSIFSNFRDARLMSNALMDTVMEPDKVCEYIQKVTERVLQQIDYLSQCGVDAVIMCDDWGTQDRTFISPQSFRNIFKPFYAQVVDRLHSYDMHFILHSCGYNYSFMEDFIDAGIDVLQFDQLGAYGYEKMANEFAHKVTFWSPLDIQMTLPTGDKQIIESEARRMLKAFYGKGGLLLKDYPTYQDIGVKEEWAAWARKIFKTEAKWTLCASL